MPHAIFQELNVQGLQVMTIPQFPLLIPGLMVMGSNAETFRTQSLQGKHQIIVVILE
jgi:hypothetical protein